MPTLLAIARTDDRQSGLAPTSDHRTHYVDVEPGLIADADDDGLTVIVQRREAATDGLGQAALPVGILDDPRVHSGERFAHEHRVVAYHSHERIGRGT